MIITVADRRYEPCPGWGELPAGWTYGDAVSVDVGADDRVYLFTRGQLGNNPDHPVIIFERDGRFVRSLGDGLFKTAHAATVDVEGNCYCVDMGDHTVRKLAPDGTLLYILGNKGVPADTGCVRFFNEITHGGPPFHMPTQVAIGPGGDLYISDGYGNCRIHQFKPDGTYIRSWGEPGTGPGQFNLVHAVWAHTDGRLFVCDRENSRVQVFREDGTFLQEWTDCVRPDDLCIGADGRVYVAELGERAGIFPFFPNPLGQSRPGRVTVRDLDGRLLGTWGNDDPYAPDGMFAPHGIAVDSRGDVYVAEVAWSGGGRTGLVDCKRKAAFTKYVRVD